MSATAALSSGPPGLRVLAVERDEHLREQLAQTLTLAGHRVRLATTLVEALQLLRDEPLEVVVADAALVGDGGVAALAAAEPPVGPVAVLAAGPHGSRYAEHGAAGWLERPWDADVLLRVVERAGLEITRARELDTLRALLGGRAETLLVGRSPAMQRLRELVQRAAATRATVVIAGEPGTGKELVARTIHALSAGAPGPCVLVECAGRDAAALERELFGAAGDQPVVGSGVLARAAGGTVIVDDASSLPAPLQARLLRVLQERVQGTATSDFRLLLTVREERPTFGAPQPPRYDLLARAGLFAIAVPPLRDRRSDIPLLANHFRARLARETGAEVPALSTELAASLIAYDWPGNVRQLEHYVGRLSLLPRGARAPFEAPAPTTEARAAAPALLDAARGSHWTLDELEREYITRVLAEERGHQSRAAQVLGIDRRTLYRKLKQYRAQDAVRRTAAGAAPPRVERSA